jgi:uncharacterized membrane protein YsdA (DUF1294 family)
MNYNLLPLYLLAALLAGSYYLGYTPPLISAIYLLVSLGAYVAYTKDKSAAQRGQWRVSENTLHTFSLCGGWPGAIIAQQRLRHKTKKVSFRVVFWLTLLANVALIMWLHTSDGNTLLHQFINNLERFSISKISSNDINTVLLLLTQFRV